VAPLSALVPVPLPVAHVPPVHYAGRTSEGRAISLSLRAGKVVAVRTTVVRYPCDPFGDVGPIRVGETGTARINRWTGRFTFAAGDEVQRVTVRGVWRRRAVRIAGTLRVVGQIATGQRCASATLHFRAQR
jgi:hypothetical protein